MRKAKFGTLIALAIIGLLATGLSTTSPTPPGPVFVTLTILSASWVTLIHLWCWVAPLIEGDERMGFTKFAILLGYPAVSYALLGSMWYFDSLGIFPWAPWAIAGLTLIYAAIVVAAILANRRRQTEHASHA